jgi:hypothetical protein
MEVPGQRIYRDLSGLYTKVIAVLERRAAARGQSLDGFLTGPVSDEFLRYRDRLRLLEELSNKRGPASDSLILLEELAKRADNLANIFSENEFLSSIPFRMVEIRDGEPVSRSTVYTALSTMASIARGKGTVPDSFWELPDVEDDAAEMTGDGLNETPTTLPRLIHSTTYRVLNIVEKKFVDRVISINNLMIECLEKYLIESANLNNDKFNDIEFGNIELITLNIKSFLNADNHSEVQSILTKILNQLDYLCGEFTFNRTYSKIYISIEQAYSIGLSVARQTRLNAVDVLRTLSKIIKDQLATLRSRFPVISSSEATASILEQAPRVSKSLPPQQIAPVKFGIENDLLVVVHDVATPDPQDVNIVNSVRQNLLSSGERLIRELCQSQCDRRFIESIEMLQAEVEANQDIIQLGMQTQGCQVTSQTFGEEFPTFHQGLLAAYLMAVMDYVGQFPDWHRFLENAAGARMLEAEMIESLRQVVRDLAGAVKNAPIAVPEVAEELEWLAEQVSDEGPVTKKKVFAVGQSLQNFAAAFVKWNLELIQKTSGKIQDFTAAGVAAVTVSMIVYNLLPFVPISNVLAATPWLGPALAWMKEWLPLLNG